jgi:hypothetical protein
MSNNLDKDQILSQIAKLNEEFKENSKKLIECRSLATEQKIRKEMQECEVKKKVLLRKLEALEEKA